MKNPRFLWIGLALSISIYLVTLFFELDLFEKMEAIFRKFEKFEIDEIVIPLIVFCLFALVHVFGMVRRSMIEAERAKIYIAMLSSTHHILNNFLDQMRSFQTAVKKTPGLDPNIMSKFDESIEEAEKQLEKLSKISHIDEISIKESLSTKNN